MINRSREARGNGSSPRKFSSIHSRLTKHLPATSRALNLSESQRMGSCRSSSASGHITARGQRQGEVSRPSMYVRDTFSFFSLWEDVLGNSLPGSWSLPAQMMRFLKDINSFSCHVELAGDASIGQRQASGRVFQHRERCVHQGAWGQEGELPGKQHRLFQVALRAEGPGQKRQFCWRNCQKQCAEQRRVE